MTSSNSKVNDVKIKVVFGKDIRRWHCSNEKNRHGELVAFVEKTFQLKNRLFQIQYEDLEMDRITLSNEQDFDDALNCALEQDRKSLRLYVVKPNREQTMESGNNSTSAKTEENKSENVTEPSASSSFSFCQQTNDNDNWQQKMMLEFLLNEDVKALLPELAGDIVRTLRENNDNTEVLVEVIQVVLSEQKYAPIVNHEFYLNRVRDHLPIWVTKIAPFSRMLSSLNEQTITLMVANAINAFTTSSASGTSFQGNNPMWNPMSFLLGGLQQGPGRATGWGSSAWCGTGPEEEVHPYVQCDECKVQPIRGPRYKCTVCENYDLCGKCEAAKNHNHPLSKVNRSGGCMNFADSINQHSNLGSQHPHECPRKKKHGEPKAQWTKDESNEPIYGVVNTVSTKIWEVKNTGSEEWAENVELVFIKGNETLALEKRYLVPKTKPEEKVQLSAAIQIPSIPGRYSASFRLHKNGKAFGPRLWVDVFALADTDNEAPVDEKKENKPVVEEKKPVEVSEVKKNVENENENESEENNIVVKCICGETMTQTSPMVAYYEGAEVNCDVCGEACTSGFIYHCYSESAKHPKGYDICMNCAYAQEFFEEHQQPEVVIPKKEEPIQSKKENETTQVQQPNPVVVNDPLIGFQYEQQARDIMEMGFTDISVIKELLIRMKGNVNEAMGELIQQ